MTRTKKISSHNSQLQYLENDNDDDDVIQDEDAKITMTTIKTTPKAAGWTSAGSGHVEYYDEDDEKEYTDPRVSSVPNTKSEINK